MPWGNGKWPSYALAEFIFLATNGPEYPTRITPMSLYGRAFFYADITQNGGQYAGTLISYPDLESVSKYLSDLSSGVTKPLDFTVYVPQGLDNLMGVPVPNVETTGDPAKIFTASFFGGREIWPEKYL
jgi:hypothetical protein